MKRILLALLLFAVPAFAQSTGPFVLTATTSPCATIGTLSNYATVGIRVSGTFSATLQPGVTIQGQPSTNTSVVPVGSTTSQNTITAAGAYTASVAGASTFQICATGFVSGTATIWLNVSTGISAKAIVSAGGAVQSVTGTAGQIASSGGANPVLSLPAAIHAPGSLDTVTPIGVASGGTGQGQAGQYGVMIARSYAGVIQSTQAEAIAFTATVPGGLLTANGVVKVHLIAKTGTLTGAANVRVRVAASGSGLTGTVLTNPSFSSGNNNFNVAGELTIAARGATNSQISGSTIRITSGLSNDVNTPSTVDTTANWDIVVTLQLANADASGIQLMGASVVVYP
jgi:hypothetical protein